MKRFRVTQELLMTPGGGNLSMKMSPRRPIAVNPQLQQAFEEGARLSQEKKRISQQGLTLAQV